MDEIANYVKQGVQKIRIVFEETSRMMRHVTNYEDFITWEHNLENALSNFPLKILMVCVYFENDVEPFCKDRGKSALSIIKDVVFSHDRLIYLCKWGRILQGTEAVIEIFEEDFAGISSKNVSN
jgi:hypothetical protein